MAKSELKIAVDVGVCVPVEQAERALKIVEWFLNDNCNVDVIIEKQLDGSVKLHFANKDIKPGVVFVPTK